MKLKENESLDRWAGRPYIKHINQSAIYRRVSESVRQEFGISASKLQVGESVNMRFINGVSVYFRATGISIYFQSRGIPVYRCKFGVSVTV